MAHPQIAVFARLANGNEERRRALEGQKTLLGRTMHAIAYDAVHDEIVVPQQFGQAVLTCAGDADGEAPPKRVIRGPRTGLVAPDRLAVDPVNDEIYVPEANKVLVYPREAIGDVPPVRVIAGPKTRLAKTRAVALDATRDLLIVVNTPLPNVARRADGVEHHELVIFERRASGDVKPKRVISALPAYGNLAVDPARGLIFVVQPPRLRTNMGLSEHRGYVGVWSIDDQGAAPPRFTIGGPGGVLIEPRGVSIDAKNSAVIVSDKQLNALLHSAYPRSSTERWEVGLGDRIVPRGSKRPASSRP